MAAGSVGVDYRELYKDLEQISERVRMDQMEFSEVMVIHRMFISLRDLDLGHLEGAERVKRLYVLADVVEAQQTNEGFDSLLTPMARFPGSISVVILCRVLWLREVSFSARITSFNVMWLQLPHTRLHAVERSATSIRMYRYDDGEDDDAYPALCIHASIVEYSKIERAHAVSQPQPSTYVLRCFALRPNPNSTNLVFSSQSRSIVDAPVREYYVYPEARNVLPSTFPTSALVDPASLFRDWYTFRIASPSFNLSSASVSKDQLEPAISLLKDNIPAAILTDANILLTLQMSVLIAELVQLAHPSKDTVEAIAKHVEWLNKLLLQATSNSTGMSSHDDYLALLFRVQCLMKTGRRARSLVVPQLQYNVYSNLINRMAQVAQSYDQALQNLKLFIVQNKILGSYLLEQNKAFAERERDMEVFHSEIISQRTIELENTILKMDHLSLQMETQSQEMDRAREDMEAGLREFQNRGVARAMFAVIGAIAMVGLAFVTGGAAAPGAVAAAGNAVTAAGQAARALQRVVEILEGLQAVMEVVVLIKDLVESLQNINELVDAPEMPEMPSHADWSIFVNEIEGVAEQMPVEVSEVSAWKTSCKNVAVLGQEMTTTAAYISQLQYDIKVNSMLQDISRNHADRLSTLRPADLSNYLEMVTQMDMRNTRMLVSLIKVVDMQNAALMYQYLSSPTPLNAWPVTMETVWSMLVQHEHGAVLGLMSLGPAFDFTRTYVVKDIPVSLLLQGEDWEFEIPVQDFVTFPSTWSRVRIHHLEMKFVKDSAVAAHQPTTATGSVYMLLQGSRIFHDRRNHVIRSTDTILHYEAAVSLDYHYAYRLDTGDTALSNLPSHDFLTTFMRMTPFTNWRLRLSASAEENKELAFPTATSADATTQIAITFHISAIRQTSL